MYHYEEKSDSKRNSVTLVLSEKKLEIENIETVNNKGVSAETVQNFTMTLSRQFRMKA